MRFRPAEAGDAEALRDLERAANLVALAHVFPPGEHPFPDDAVLARWRDTLAEPSVIVEVVDRAASPDASPDGGPAGRLDCFVARDTTTLRHLAVHPDRWGTGLGRAAVARAVAGIRAGGQQPLLWCLAENHRARRFYEHLGWAPTGATQRALWPPHPTELQYVLPDSERG